MVYCVKCGAKSPDEAKVCSQCGSSLYSVGKQVPHKQVEKECFGIPGGGVIVGIAFGAIIILWGLILALEAAGIIEGNVPIWPFVVILIGTLMVVGAIYALRRRQ
ncbi:zinc-ribbon domain-containing protein [Candidatus Bathyarchaeota archaeon]|nr:zinc-ribbon domain-containing protein [Candidatus Bathyarchaeota archaeon]